MDASGEPYDHGLVPLEAAAAADAVARYAARGSAARA